MTLIDKSSLYSREQLIPSISADILVFSNKIWYDGITKIQYHELLKNSICNLAKSYNYNGVCEYELPNYQRKLRKGNITTLGFVDVFWYKQSYPVIVFEIDSGLRKKSIDKLLFTYNSIVFWINYGKHKPYLFLKEHDPEKKINLIRIENLKFI